MTHDLKRQFYASLALEPQPGQRQKPSNRAMAKRVLAAGTLRDMARDGLGHEDIVAILRASGDTYKLEQVRDYVLKGYWR